MNLSDFESLLFAFFRIVNMDGARNEEFESVVSSEEDEEGVNDATQEKKAKRPGGAPKSSILEAYSRYNTKTNKTTCTVKTKSDNLCGKEYVGKSPSSLLKHIRSAHSEIKIDEDKKRKMPSTSGFQLSLVDSFGRNAKSAIEKYPKSHPKQQATDNKLATLIGSTNMPKSFVERSEFRDFLNELDPRYTAPTRQDISQKIVDIDLRIRKAIKLALDEVECISAVCADIWSRKGLTASYLGITAHYFDKKTQSIRRILLGLEKIDYPHSAERILESMNTVLNKWEIDLYSDKIHRILTDNGTNIVKAFRGVINEIYFSSSDDLNFHEVDGNLEAEEDDFEKEETMLTVNLGREKRLSCIDHQLARILMLATEGKTTRNWEGCDPTTKQIIDSVHKLLAKLPSRGKATEYFVATFGKKLLQPPRTRWAYHFYVLDRMLELKEGIRHVIDNEIVDDVDNLTPNQWKLVKALRDILELFSVVITKLEGDQYVTLSRVIPFLIDIKLGLLKPEKISALPVLGQKLRSLMDSRFDFIFNSDHVPFEPIYAIATLLDPKVIRTFELEALQKLKQAAITEIERLLIGYGKSATTDVFPTSTPAIVNDEMANFPHLLALINASAPAQTSAANGSSSTAKSEIHTYLKIVYDRVGENNLDFWHGQMTTMPNLYKLATMILAIPATTAPVERLFSQARYCLGNNRHNLDDKNLERELMIRINKF